MPLFHFVQCKLHSVLYRENLSLSGAMRGERQKKKLFQNFNFNCTEFGVENFIYT